MRVGDVGPEDGPGKCEVCVGAWKSSRGYRMIATEETGGLLDGLVSRPELRIPNQPLVFAKIGFPSDRDSLCSRC